MKIVIIGPGAMGSLLAGLLASAHEVHILDKHPARAAQIMQQGLQIEDQHGRRRIPIRVTTHAVTLAGADLVIVCVKAFDTGSVLPALTLLAASHTQVLTLQNGLGNVEQLLTILPASRVFAGVTAHGATLLGTGHVRHAGSGPTTVSSPHAHQRAIKKLAHGLSAAGLATEPAPEILPVLWSKLVINAAIGPVSALAGVPNGQLLELRSWRDLLRAAALESAAVAERQGIRLLYPDPVAAVEEVCRRTATNFSSMLQDVRRGGRTEIDAINGAIIRAAAALDLATPVNTDLVRRLRAASG